MKEKPRMKRLLCLMLAALMVLSLAACGGGGRGPKDSDAPAEQTEAAKPEKQEKDETAVSGSALYEDSLIAEHAQHNEGLNALSDISRKADSFHLYVTNTETMEGFVSGRGIKNFHNSVQSAFEAASNMMYGQLTGHYLNYPQGSRELTWMETEMNDMFQQSIRSAAFYSGHALPNTGTLAPLFRTGESPFEENGLTMILTNFVEPGFDMNSLYSGIKQYFDAYPGSAACVVGFTSQFEGYFHIPQDNLIGNKTTYCVRKFDSEVPCYMVLVGPEQDVHQYTEILFKLLENRDVEYSHSLYANSVYKQLVADTLEFDLIADRKTKSAPAAVMGSYNAGTLKAHDRGYAFFSSYKGIETRDADRGSSTVANSTQVSVLSKNYDGSFPFEWEKTLYVYDASTGTWKDAGKNAAAMAYVTVKSVDGPLVDEFGKEDEDKFSLLAAGRREMYLSARLDFTDEAILSRDKIYRLEVRLVMNRENPDAQTESNTSELAAMSISGTEYYKILDHLSIGSENNYFWPEGPSLVARNIVSRTPNLEALLINLQELEAEYSGGNQIIEYVDFVFNIPEANGRR